MLGTVEPSIIMLPVNVGLISLASKMEYANKLSYHRQLHDTLGILPFIPCRTGSLRCILPDRNGPSLPRYQIQKGFLLGHNYGHDLGGWRFWDPHIRNGSSTEY